MVHQQQSWRIDGRRPGIDGRVCATHSGPRRAHAIGCVGGGGQSGDGLVGDRGGAAADAGGCRRARGCCNRRRRGDWRVAPVARSPGIPCDSRGARTRDGGVPHRAEPAASAAGFLFLAGAAAVCAGRGAEVIGGLFAKRELATAGVAVALATTSALALPRNYQIPKQDFVSAMAFLDGEAANGSSIAAAGPACFPVEHYFERPAWRCLESTEDLSSFLGATSPVLIVHTLGAYIEDAQLRERVLNACEPVRTFPGTLGGGDVVVCRPVRGVRP